MKNKYLGIEEDWGLYQARTNLIEEMKIKALNDRVIYIWENISENTEFMFNRTVEKFLEKDSLLKVKPPIEIKMSTLGGYVFSTLSIMSTIDRLKALGYVVKISAYGCAMSGGLFILMCGSKGYRQCQKSTRFLLHQVQSESFGRTSVEMLKREFDEMKDLWDYLAEEVKKNTNIGDDLLESVTKADKDHYFFGEKAIELGLVDSLF